MKEIIQKRDPEKLQPRASVFRLQMDTRNSQQMPRDARHDFEGADGLTQKNETK